MAGDIDIVIGAKDKASAIINSVASKVGSFGGSFAALGPAAIGVGSALAGATAAFVSFGAVLSTVQEAADKIDALTDTAAGLGSAVGDLQAFQFAMSEAGNVDAEKSIQALQRIQKTVGEIAGGGNKAGAEIFDQLSIDANSLSLQNPIDQFMTVKAALGGIENVSERAATAQKLLGKSAADLIPALISEQAEFEASMAAANAFGVTVSEEGAAGIAAMNDSIGRVSAGMEGIANQAAVALAPAVEAIATAIATWMPPTIQIAEQYLPSIVDAFVVAAGYAYDVSKALLQLQTLDFAGAFDTFSDMDSGEKWLAAVEENRDAAAKAAEESAARMAALASVNGSVDEEAEKALAKQAEAVAKTIGELERKLAVEMQSEEIVKSQEQLALATNDAERERIALLQQQISVQEKINESAKKAAEEEKKATEEKQKKFESVTSELQKQYDIAILGADAVEKRDQVSAGRTAEEQQTIRMMQEKVAEAEKQNALGKAQTGTTAVESRMLTRGPSERGIDKIASATQKSATTLEGILTALTDPTTKTDGLQLELVN
jgi:hypothetical protein